MSRFGGNYEILGYNEDYFKGLDGNYKVPLVKRKFYFPMQTILISRLWRVITF